jgi:6-phosphogluconolactonase (cycloisomerase 2 family)
MYAAPVVPPTPATVTITAVDQLDASLTASTSAQLTGLFAYVSNQGNGSNNGSIYGFSISAAGALTPLPNFPVAQPKPYFLVADNQGKHLYVADISSFGTNFVYIYSIDPVTGGLTLLGTTGIGSGARQIAIDPSGTRLYGDVMDGASAGIHGFSINPATGALTPLPGSPFANPGSRPASISFDPAGRYAFAANNASRNVSVFSANSVTGQLTAVGAFAAGRAPQWAITDASGAHLYVQDGLDSVIYAYDIAGSGALSPLSIPTFSGVNSALTSVFSPDGKFLYVPNWVGSGSNPGLTTVFSINASSGVLTPIPGSPFTTGKFPTFVAIEPSGQFAIVANQSDGNVQGISLNAATGAMSPLTTVPAGITPTILAIVTTKP